MLAMLLRAIKRPVGPHGEATELSIGDFRTKQARDSAPPTSGNCDGSGPLDSKAPTAFDRNRPCFEAASLSAARMAPSIARHRPRSVATGHDRSWIMAQPAADSGDHSRMAAAPKLARRVGATPGFSSLENFGRCSALNYDEKHPSILAGSVRLFSLPWTRELTRPPGTKGARTMMCSQYMQQIRLLEMAEREFHHAHFALMEARKWDDAKSARETLRLAVKNRNACRVALLFHERDHGCPTLSVSA
jgi:hypothetical protein